MAARFYYSELGLLIDVEKGQALSLEEAKVAALLDLARQAGSIADRLGALAPLLNEANQRPKKRSSSEAAAPAGGRQSAATRKRKS